jgi:glutathione-independent formaldehyde dehydrogenase
VVQTNIWLEEEPPPRRLVLGHEITGEVIELGRDVEFIKKGDIVSVPFNVACGRCQNCKTV